MLQPFFSPDQNGAAPEPSYLCIPWPENIIDGRHHVTLFTHPSARCRDCRRWVRQEGTGEILGSRIGPYVRSMAIYLRNEIGVSYRKVSRAIEDLLGLNFTPAALIGFEKLLAQQAQPIVADIEKKIASTEGSVHADETYWTLDGDRAYYWVHTTEDYVHFPANKGPPNAGNEF